MRSRHQQLTASQLRLCYPDLWVVRVRVAMRRAKGRVPIACIALGVSESALHVWLRDPRLVAAEIPRAKTGRPKGTPRAEPAATKKVCRHVHGSRVRL
jgi:hypothetical protein